MGSLPGAPETQRSTSARTEFQPPRRPRRLGAGLAALATIALLSVASACATKATPDQCARACQNVAQIYMGVTDELSSSQEVLQQMGETGAAMAREMASHYLDFLQGECERECNDKGTSNFADCLIEARTTADLDRCQD